MSELKVSSLRPENESLKKFANILLFYMDKLSYLIASFTQLFPKSDSIDNPLPVCKKSTHWHLQNMVFYNIDIVIDNVLVSQYFA